MNLSNEILYKSRKILEVNKQKYYFFSLDIIPAFSKLPFTLKILLENYLRYSFYNKSNIVPTISNILTWPNISKKNLNYISFIPNRILMQDFTGLPCLIDLASMKSFLYNKKLNPHLINPVIKTDLVIDHSLQVDYFGNTKALKRNMDLEFIRNKERYEFLKWSQKNFKNLRIIPPGNGIVHQINIEYLSKVVDYNNVKNNDSKILNLYPDTCLGTDSHTTMVNSLGILGWGIGGIEAESLILGEPLLMPIPEIIGCEIYGSRMPGVTTTDIVLTMTKKFRKYNLINKFIEFYGNALCELSLPDRATISNMSPEFGSTAAMFPIDEKCLEYLYITGRSKKNINLIKSYSKKQNLWIDSCKDIVYSKNIKINLSNIYPSIAGPSKPNELINLRNVKEIFNTNFQNITNENKIYFNYINKKNLSHKIKNGDVVIASITSCTNTSNPVAMIQAGILAKNAIKFNLFSQPWVKTSLAPGSKVVQKYYKLSGLGKYLEKLGFFIIGYGCSTCIGNSGPLFKEIEDNVKKYNLQVASVTSGNRNFEGRINPLVKLNYIMSPPLVIAYSLVGTMNFDFYKEPLKITKKGIKIFLKDIWPSEIEVDQFAKKFIKRNDFIENYKNIYIGNDHWKKLKFKKNKIFAWNKKSTYICQVPYFKNLNKVPKPIKNVKNVRIILKLGNSITTDHISPAGAFNVSSEAGQYLLKIKNILPNNFNSYGTRRGNHKVMMRGAFSNIRLRNLILEKVKGGFTKDFTKNDEPQTTIYQACKNYKIKNIPLAILAGQNYGIGSSRDWAAKATSLLGIKFVVAKSFESIHRSNLIGMGVLPLQIFKEQEVVYDKISGSEILDIYNLSELNIKKIPKYIYIDIKNAKNNCIISRLKVKPLIHTINELNYYLNGGILQYTLRSFLNF